MIYVVRPPEKTLLPDNWLNLSHLANPNQFILIAIAYHVRSLPWINHRFIFAIPSIKNVTSVQPHIDYTTRLLDVERNPDSLDEVSPPAGSGFLVTQLRVSPLFSVSLFRA